MMRLCEIYTVSLEEICPDLVDLRRRNVVARTKLAGLSSHGHKRGKTALAFQAEHVKARVSEGKSNMHSRAVLQEEQQVRCTQVIVFYEVRPQARIVRGNSNTRCYS